MKCNDAFYVGICPSRRKNGECVSTFPCRHKTAPLTNAERIRTMNDEELAQNINRLLDGEIAVPYCRGLPECDDDLERDALIPLERCEQCVLHWLQQPAEEG